MSIEKGHRVITKWFQPYAIFESVKKYFDIAEYTFMGYDDKVKKKKLFLDEINSSQDITIGLYMKNISKFYIMKLKSEIKENSDISALENLLFKNQFNSDEKYNSDEWMKITKDTEEAIMLVDMAKAEASFIMKLG